MKNKKLSILMFILLSSGCAEANNSEVKLKSKEVSLNFPSNFQKFYELADDGLISMKDVDRIFSKTKEKNVLHRIISVGVNGGWDADVVNYFQKRSVNLLKSDTKMVCQQLKSFKSNDRQSYFRFLIESEKENLLNSENIKENCETGIYNDLLAAKNTYKEIKRIGDGSVSVRRYGISDFNNKNEKIYMDKTMDFNSDGYLDRILVTKDNVELKENQETPFKSLYVLQNYGDNTYFILHNNNMFFENLDSNCMQDRLSNIATSKTNFTLEWVGCVDRKFADRLATFHYNNKLKFFQLIKDNIVVHQHIEDASKDKIYNCKIGKSLENYDGVCR